MDGTDDMTDDDELVAIAAAATNPPTTPGTRPGNPIGATLDDKK